VFEGNSQTLDHILVSDNLLAANAELDVLHINAEFADQASDHDPSVARFTLSAPNSPPVANDDSIRVRKNGSETFVALANDFDPDGDTLDIINVSAPANGTAKETAAGKIRYIPRKGFTGTDSFTYTISDGNGGTDTATVFVTVTKK
jgi:hypothetical protein